MEEQKWILRALFLSIKKNESAYKTVRNNVKRTLKSLIDDAGIMAIVSARVKDSERLKEKLLDRNQEAHYSSHNEIVADMQHE